MRELPVERLCLCQPDPAICVGIDEGELHGLKQPGLVQDGVVIGDVSKLDHALP